MFIALGITALLMGSVAGTVIRRAKCPLLIVENVPDAPLFSGEQEESQTSRFSDGRYFGTFTIAWMELRRIQVRALLNLLCGLIFDSLPTTNVTSPCVRSSKFSRVVS